MRTEVNKVFVQRKSTAERKGTEPYEVSLKLKVIRQYLKGDKSFAMLGKQYGIHPGILSRWVRVAKYGHPVKEKKEKWSKFAGMNKKINRSPEDLMAEVKLLRKQLEEEQLKTLVYEKIIEIAERDLKLDIVKKYNVKRSLRSGK
jgi:transposase-like protein